MHEAKLLLQYRGQIAFHQRMQKGVGGRSSQLSHPINKLSFTDQILLPRGGGDVSRRATNGGHEDGDNGDHDDDEEEEGGAEGYKVWC